MHYLLIGNGPSALAKPMGKEIDAFPGHVVRFNNYQTKGQEDFVGTRTDVWATIGLFPCFLYLHKTRWWLQSSTAPAHEEARVKLAAEVPAAGWRNAASSTGYSNPSSGFALCAWLISQGHEVTLWGFDFMNEHRKHHWSDNAERGLWHDGWREWLFFAAALMEKKIKYLGWDPIKEGFPVVRTPVPCGLDQNVNVLREPCQMGWYEFFAKELYQGGSVLDVGAGTCTGMHLYEKLGITNVVGIEWDERLKGTHPGLLIVKDLGEIPDNSYDCITCMDVLEHVVEDLVFFNHLKRIARESVFLTTPNGHRSACLNGAHCREYTIPLFANIFLPDRLWSGAPDGRSHRTLLLESHDDWYVNLGEEGMGNKRKPATYTAFPVGKMPLSTRFNITVDGEEWPHIAAEFFK